MIPNPVSNGELILVSEMEKTSFDLIGFNGMLIHSDSFNGVTYRYNMATLPSGIYFIKYKDPNGYDRYVKFVK